MALENIFGDSSQLFVILKSVLNILMYVIAFGMMGVAAFVVGFFFFRPMFYKLDVEIYAERQGKQVHAGRDKARIKKVRSKFFGLMGPIKKTSLELLKRKVELPTPAFDKVYPNDLRNSPGTIILLKRGERDYRIAKIHIDGEALARIEPLDDHLIEFIISETKNIEERNSPNDWLSKYGVIIAAGGVIIVLIIGLYAGYKYYHVIFDSLGNALTHLDRTLESLNRCKV